MRKKFWTLIMGTSLAIGLAACGGGGDDNADNNAGNNAGDNGGETVADGEAIYQQSCVSCHGENLEGRNGPALDKIGAELSKDEILDAIEEGRPGMPPGLVKGDDAEKVASWLAEKK